MRAFIITLIILISFQTGYAGIINVPDDAATIQEGINLANAGDTVLVAANTYTGVGNRDLTFSGKDITLMSEGGPQITIIDAEGSESDPHRCCLFINGETALSSVIGFTFKGGYAIGSDHGLAGNGGGVICLGSSPTFKDCVFTQNTSYRHGAGLYCEYGASPFLFSCRFIGNTALQNGGAFASEGALSYFQDCEFSGNSANYSGALHLGSGSDIYLSQCLIYSNTAQNAGGAAGFYGSNPTFRNCTISHNASIKGQIYCDNESTLSFFNSIISFGIGNSAVYCSSGIATLSCCDVFGNELGDYVDCLFMMENQNNNISLDPLFNLDDSTAMYTLQMYSPCLPSNNGCGQLIGARGFLIAGHIPPFALRIGFDPGSEYVAGSSTPDIYWDYYDTASTAQAAVEIEVGTDDDWNAAEMWSSGQVNSGDTTVLYAGVPLEDGTSYYLRIRLNNGAYWGGWEEFVFDANLDNIIYVPDEIATIQGGVDAALNGDTVYVGAGIYSGSGNRDIDFSGKDIVLISLEGADNTIINCEGSSDEPHRAFRFASGESAGAVVDGFTMTNGFGLYERDNPKGGAIYCTDASPTIRNCVFENNIGSGNGGAISAWGSSVSITNCIFRHNHAICGSAIYYNGLGDERDIATSNVTNCRFEFNAGISNDVSYSGAIHMQYEGMTVNLNGCLFYGNEADIGGAFTVWENAVLNISGCTIVGNESYMGDGGIFYIFRNPTLNIENSIIAFGGEGESVICDGIPDIDIQCTDIYGNAGGNWTGCFAGFAGVDGNISEDPLFCNFTHGFFKLQPESPCAAENNSCGSLIGAFDTGCAICGDVNGSASINLVDVVVIINYIFVGGAAPNPPEAADTNCSGEINIADAIWLINYIFLGGNPPCDLDGNGSPDC